MQLGYIGLGKMGLNMSLRLREKGYDVVGHNKSDTPKEEAEKHGIVFASSIREMVEHLSAPRLVWIMVPHIAVDTVLEGLLPLLSEGDTVIDGGNSYYKDSMRRAAAAGEKGVRYLDVGVSGGPAGARHGACLMIGGDEQAFLDHERLFRDLAVEGGYKHVGKAGAGHFVKMIHNGIEYGMMQAIAEGFAIMRASEFDPDPVKVADIYNHKSVIESRLVAWAKDGFERYGKDLEDVSGSVGHTGEGEWTVKVAKELGIPAPIIEGSFQFRVESEKDPSYTGKVLSMLRNMFGGHDIG